jgi:hypothetical protein
MTMQHLALMAFGTPVFEAKQMQLRSHLERRRNNTNDHE